MEPDHRDDFGDVAPPAKRSRDGGGHGKRGEVKVMLSFLAPRSIRTRLRLYVAKVERSATEVAIEALDEYLSRRES